MPPLHSTKLVFLFLILHLYLYFTTCVLAQRCNSEPEIFRSPCPPFTSTLSFPFSTLQGCGHPSFQIKCSTPHSTISINNLTFSILHYDPNSLSLTITPHLLNTTTKANDLQAHSNCSSSHFPSIPNRSINLSGSPFRASDSSCSRLAFLQPCSHLKPAYCEHCAWECDLIENPLQLLHGCTHSSTQSPISDQRCQDDILGYLDKFFSSIGIELEWDEAQDTYFSSCKDCESKNGVCGFNSTDPEKQFICSHYDHNTHSSPWPRQHSPKRLAILCSIFLFATLLLVATAIFRSKRLKLSSPSDLEDPNTLFLHRHRSASLLPPVFTYEDLESSTNKFDPKRKIGDGGFGSVYLGQLHDNRIVAVKYLHHHKATSKAFSTKSFCNEILILSSIQHPNLVKLHGYCSDPRGLILVYDYVPNGTLADHLHSRNKASLSWNIRVDIALQTALAIEYLHFSVKPAIVHRDITSSNIFVERDMRIKVGDFGLSRLLVFPETTSSSSSSGYVWTGPQGTPGYLDPDYHRSFRLTEKSDVYSFGVVLLELISGLRPVDQSRDKREFALADLVVSKIQMGLLHQVVDPALRLDHHHHHGGVMDGVDAVAELAFRCVAADKDDRPDAKEVVEELKRIRSCTTRDIGCDDVAKS
ncbi:LEAF RUST 10 DISEASE-RESISTANCE LOCUS RECEPTOR-LIKE PROTEIN KINASE-like 1.5 [Quercus lobata]|uniref:Protein kinase domain-containing protein n=1 Tax=Quercus lobata TaxID=97700 RepID=A0A7N2LAJ6_QUELO|nr:LEAF RUST 10 DISEASE-RESISTANCE LOCUS RECEPTOR-LIKE PROTEIN KINASE-like 1.5 [Quercus lobata]